MMYLDTAKIGRSVYIRHVREYARPDFELVKCLAIVSKTLPG